MEVIFKKNDWRWRNRLAIKQYLVCEKNVKKKTYNDNKNKNPNWCGGVLL